MLSKIAVLSLCLGLSLAIELPKKCGLSHFHKTPRDNFRIVGGQPAQKGFFPWIVFLNKTIEYMGYQTYSDCGGSIISSKWILSAAHCFQDVPDDTSELSNAELGIRVTIDAIFGAVNLNEQEVTQVHRNISRIIRSGGFNESTRSNDIAILELDRELDFAGAESHLMPICLHTANIESPGLKEQGKQVNVSECYIAGFGYEDQRTEVNDFILHYVREDLATHRDCYRAHTRYNSEWNLCVGGENNKGTCKGDSGSPMVCHDNGKWTQIGLVSNGIPCAWGGIPDVLTDVGHFHDWIVKQK